MTNKLPPVVAKH